MDDLERKEDEKFRHLKDEANLRIGGAAYESDD